MEKSEEAGALFVQQVLPILGMRAAGPGTG